MKTLTLAIPQGRLWNRRRALKLPPQHERSSTDRGYRGQLKGIEDIASHSSAAEIARTCATGRLIWHHRREPPVGKIRPQENLVSVLARSISSVMLS
jgi:hypothetical protein